MPQLRRSLPALLLVAVTACGGAPTAGDKPGDQTPGDTVAPKQLDVLPRPLTAGEKTAVSASDDFSFALFREVNKRKAKANVFVSPLSASVALAMTAQGANGATETAMRGTLGFANQSLAEMGDSYRTLFTLLLGLDKSVTLTSANAIWYRRGLAVQPAFVDATQRSFGAAVQAADFADVAGTVNAINGWAKEKTNGKIDKVLETIRPENVMFLLNALYFKGSWRDKFDAKLTAAGPFTNADGSKSTVQMMHRQADIKWSAGNGYEAVDLPYGNAAFSMTVILPATGSSADALATSLDARAWDQLVSGFHDAKIDLALPRLQLKYEDEWKDVLTTLGMGVAFTDQADFTRMVQGGGVAIDFVKQNTFVDVNEEGTEAAAVTTVGISLTSAPVVRDFHVDRPFLFAIRERLTGAVLFVGKVDKL